MEKRAGIGRLAASPSALGRRLPRGFFEAPAEQVAPRLLGRILAARTADGWAAGRIVEVEAYLGPHHATADPAAHSHRGETARNSVLFGPAGHAYVYQIYGRSYCMNVSCEPAGHAGCVLIRALEPVAGIVVMARNRGLAIDTRDIEEKNVKAKNVKAKDAELTSGPGRLCQALGIERASHNGLDLTSQRSALQILDDGCPVANALVTVRIGIRHAAELPLRFAVPGHPCVSGPRKLTGQLIPVG